MKRSVTSFLNQVSDVFYIPPEDDDEPIFLDRLTAIIYTLGSDPATFLVDPDAADFDAWQETLNLESQQDDIAALMANNEKLRQNFETLVPSKVSSFYSVPKKGQSCHKLRLSRYLRPCFGLDIYSVFMPLERKKLRDRSFVKKLKFELRLTLKAAN